MRLAVSADDFYNVVRYTAGGISGESSKRSIVDKSLLRKNEEKSIHINTLVGDREISLLRSRRKTLALEIRPDGSILVRAPQRMADGEIRRFVSEKADWIERHLEKLEIRRAMEPPVEQLSEEEIRQLAALARQVIPERVAYYAPKVGVSYGRITIRSQRTRWGSCSAKGNLNFNCLLMLAPSEVLDSVVVHELCHRLEMNHSDRFYAQVYRVYPEYDRCRRWLKENGNALMRKGGLG